MTEFDFLPSEIQKIFGKPSVYIGEDITDYELLMRTAVTLYKPYDLATYLAVKDWVDANWELRRLRFAKPAMLNALFPDTACHHFRVVHLGKLPPPAMITEIREVLREINEGAGEEALARLNKLLEPLHANVEMIMASSFQRSIKQQVSVDRMIGATLDRSERAAKKLAPLKQRIIASKLFAAQRRAQQDQEQHNQRLIDELMKELEAEQANERSARAKARDEIDEPENGDIFLPVVPTTPINERNSGEPLQDAHPLAPSTALPGDSCGAAGETDVNRKVSTETHRENDSSDLPQRVATADTNAVPGVSRTDIPDSGYDDAERGR
jgi:hypothetical protein